MAFAPICIHRYIFINPDYIHVYHKIDVFNFFFDFSFLSLLYPYPDFAILAHVTTENCTIEEMRERKLEWDS
jgi:hypothetical protein